MRNILIAAIAIAMPLAATAAPLGTQQKQAIDDSVAEWLAKTGAPSVSIAVASGGDVVYAKAYGRARLNPDLPATTDTRYDIGSVSKQFTASAILMLQEEGKLSLDDKVSKYFPSFTDADKVTIRELLSHTSGYRDSVPQDFLTPEVAKPITTAALLEEWATKPLDFAPGTQLQYSNTGYAIAGAIVEKVSGEPLFSFLMSHICVPLNMTRAIDYDIAPLPPSDAAFYTRYANGPIRSAPPEGSGWRFGSGDLAMSPSDLARWDISLMNRSLLKPQSYDSLYTSTKLKDGSDTGYSLGLQVWHADGRLGLGHDGGGSGSSAENDMWPSEKMAIVVLTNNDWARATDVVSRVAYIVLPPTAPAARARAVFAGFQKGSVDRTLFTNNANAFLTASVLADQQAGLAPLGPVRTFSLAWELDRGGFHTTAWQIVTATATLTATERAVPNGKIEEFLVVKAD